MVAVIKIKHLLSNDSCLEGENKKNNNSPQEKKSHFVCNSCLGFLYHPIVVLVKFCKSNMNQSDCLILSLQHRNYIVDWIKLRKKALYNTFRKRNLSLFLMNSISWFFWSAVELSSKNNTSWWSWGHLVFTSSKLNARKPKMHFTNNYWYMIIKGFISLFKIIKRPYYCPIHQ